MHKENNKHAIPLLLSLQEISINDYKEKYGQASLEGDPVTVVAENLAKVTLNKIVLEKDRLKPGDLLSIRTFNNTDYIVIIDNITYGSRVLSIIGKIGKTDYGYLNLSVADNLVLASLNLTELNSIYLLRYNHYSGNYYLFEAPYDKIEKPVRY